MDGNRIEMKNDKKEKQKKRIGNFSDEWGIV
jgi:hypothetical protein